MTQPFPTIPKIDYSADEIPTVKTEIRSATHSLRDEITRFIEHQVELGYESVRYPIFYTKAFNFLKQECADIDHRDRVLDFLPQAVEMVMLTEAGPSPHRPQPVLGADGMLAEPMPEQQFYEEVRRFIADIAEYVRNGFMVTGSLPRLPHAYIMTLIHFQRRFQRDERVKSADNFNLVCHIPILLQKCLEQSLGADRVPADYVKRGNELQHHPF